MIRRKNQQAQKKGYISCASDKDYSACMHKFPFYILYVVYSYIDVNFNTVVLTSVLLVLYLSHCGCYYKDKRPNDEADNKDLSSS